METKVQVRQAVDEDRAFIFSLSPNLSEVAELEWHSDSTIQTMQDDYITEMLAPSSTPNITLIAEANGIPLGFVHARLRKDTISEELSGTIPLLAVSPSSQGLGVGKILMSSAEDWAKQQGVRLLHLEVFATNQKASAFYQKLGFKAEMVHMIKAI